MGRATDETVHGRSLVREPVHVHRHRIVGEGLRLDVMIAIVGGDLGDEDRQGGIHIGHVRVHVPARPFAEAIVCPRGGARLAMNAVGLGMEEEVGDLGLGATRYARVGRDRGLLLGLVRGRDHILLFQGTAAGVGRGQLAEEGGVSVILGIADRGRLA